MSAKRRVYGYKQDFSSSVCRKIERQPLLTLSQNLETIERSSANVQQQSKPEPSTLPLPRKDVSVSNKMSDKKRGQPGKQGKGQQQGPTVKGERRSTKIKTRKHSNDIHGNFSRIEPNFDEGSADCSIFSSAPTREFDDKERKRLLQLQEHVRSDKCINRPFNHQRPICFTPKSYAKWTESKPSCVNYSANSADDESVFKAIMNSSTEKHRKSSHTMTEKHHCKAGVPPVNSLFTLVGSTIDLIQDKLDFADASEITMNENMFAPSSRKETRNVGDDDGPNFRQNDAVSHELDNDLHNLQQKISSDPPLGIVNERAEGRSDVQQEWDKVALPSGWIMKRARKTGRAYYVHAGYGSTWCHPLQPPPSSAKIMLTEVPSTLKRASAESKCNTRLKATLLFDKKKHTKGNGGPQSSSGSALQSGLVQPWEGYNLQTKVRKKVWHHQACSLQRLGYSNR